MTLQEKQAQMTILSLQIESLQTQYQNLRVEVIKEMNENQIKKEEKK